MDDRTRHVLQAMKLLYEFTDEIPGSRLRLPGPVSVWVHTEADVKAWLADMMGRVEQGHMRDELYEQVVLNPDFFPEPK